MNLDHIITGFEVRVSHNHRQLIFRTFFLPLVGKNAFLKLVTLLRVDELCPDVFRWMNILTLNGDSLYFTCGLQ